jgi:hypothetical protein
MVLPKLGGTFDVCEKKSDGAGRENRCHCFALLKNDLAFAKSIFAPTRLLNVIWSGEPMGVSISVLSSIGDIG